MTLLAPVDNYCERIDAGLLSEPLNALTNISFFIAAWLLYRVYRDSGKRDGGLAGLIGCIALVGAGSLSFHTFGNNLAMWADVLPITLFVFYYLFMGFRRLLGYHTGPAILGLAAFLFICILLGMSPFAGSFNGSASYFPCLAAIIAMYWQLRKNNHPSAHYLNKAAWFFTISLIFRSVDMAVCDTLPIATHYLWHLLNGAVLYLLARALFHSRPVVTN